jgi:hypothetical protein
MSRSRMLGNYAHTGPGGRDCVCCNEAPGKNRKIDRRRVKRGERQDFNRSVRQFVGRI